MPPRFVRRAWMKPAVLAVSLALIGAISLPMPVSAAPKQRVEKEADLPRFSYSIKERLEQVVRDKALFDKVTAPIRTDIESVLAGYDIADKSSERQYLGILAQLDFLAGRYDAALAHAEQSRMLEEKPASKLLSGMRLRAMVAAVKATGELNTPAYMQAVADSMRKELSGLDYSVIANDIRGAKASAELISEGRIIGGVNDSLQATLDKAGSLSSDIAPGLINARYAIVTIMPLKETLVGVYSAYLDAHKVDKADIWAARQVTLPSTNSGAYTPVNVAVWDSGVDTQLFPNQVLMDSAGKPAVIAFDLDSRPDQGVLYPIPAALQPKLPQMLSHTKGFSDLQSNIDSPEAAEVKRYMSTLKPEEFTPAMEQLGLTGNYVHGTHVAGIITAGNPWVRLLTARISFDYKIQPEPCPSMELSERVAKAHQSYVDYFKQNKVHVVNMSWGGNVKGVEEALEQCGIGKTVEERQTLARTYFDMEKTALVKAFASAPEILFVTAAGNSNSDSSFGEFIPSSIVASNLLTTGAVDKAGDEAPFTSYGPTVKVHANGYQVESYLPGGSRVALSGTSMASPNVANLAAKLLAVKPSLKPAEVIAIIRETAETTADGRRTLINPAKAMARVQ